jgi:hypothetical protein
MRYIEEICVVVEDVGYEDTNDISFSWPGNQALVMTEEQGEVLLLGLLRWRLEIESDANRKIHFRNIIYMLERGRR